jgi:hypothetical protein
VLEQEGQLTYRPRYGYFVTDLSVEDLTEIYGVRSSRCGPPAPSGTRPRCIVPSTTTLAERVAAVQAHDRILDAARDADADALDAGIDAHRSCALQVPSRILSPPVDPYTRLGHWSPVTFRLTVVTSGLVTGKVRGAASDRFDAAADLEPIASTGAHSR